MSNAFSRSTQYSSKLASVLRRLDDLVDWERSNRVRGANRLMRVSAQPARALLSRLGIDPAAVPAVHITGSKGKGSVAALVAAGLGFKNVGVYASPHVEHVNERISIRGNAIDDEKLANALARALDARNVAPLLTDATWFDVMTAAALSEFARAGVQHAVIEAGMGARRDATAIVRAPVAVVTNVFDEHADIIGPTRADIAYEKAGIVRKGTHTLVLGLHPADSVTPIFQREAASIDPPSRIIYVPPVGSLRDRNTALAAAALAALGKQLPTEPVGLPARQESFKISGTHVVLDGAHVANSVTAILEEAHAANAVVVVALGADKDSFAIASSLRDAGVQHVVATETGPQIVYMRTEVLARHLITAGFSDDAVSQCSCPLTAVRRALAIARDGAYRLVIVVGSLHLAGRVRPLLRELAAKKNDTAISIAK